MEVCKVGAIGMLLRFVTKDIGDEDLLDGEGDDGNEDEEEEDEEEDEDEGGAAKAAAAAAGGEDGDGEDGDDEVALMIAAANLRRTADKALLHLVLKSNGEADPLVLSGDEPYITPAEVVETMVSDEFGDEGRRRVMRLVAVLTKDPENCAALGPAAVPPLVEAVSTWAEAIEDTEPNGSSRDVTCIQPLGEVMFALQSLSQLATLGGEATAAAVGTDQIISMLVTVLYGATANASATDGDASKASAIDQPDYGQADGTVGTVGTVGSIAASHGGDSDVNQGEVVHDLCVVTDLAWDFGPPPGEELSIERRVLRYGSQVVDIGRCTT